MKNLVKVIVLSFFGLGAVFMLFGSMHQFGNVAAMNGRPEATPPAGNSAKPMNANMAANTKMAANTAANTKMTPAANTAGNTKMAPAATPVAAPKATPVATTAPSSGGGTKIQDTFILSTHPLNKNKQYGDVKFDHVSHSTMNYSPDGKSKIACTECHHTDQPKSALKPPLVTAERTEALTLANLKSTSEVKRCSACHFQTAPDDKEMPVYTVNGEEVELDNQYAYHQNCNVCHDKAAEMRPALTSKPGFAQTSSCFVCHTKK